MLNTQKPPLTHVNSECVNNIKLINYFSSLSWGKNYSINTVKIYEKILGKAFAEILIKFKNHLRLINSPEWEACWAVLTFYVSFSVLPPAKYLLESLPWRHSEVDLFSRFFPTFLQRWWFSRKLCNVIKKILIHKDEEYLIVMIAYNCCINTPFFISETLFLLQRYFLSVLHFSSELEENCFGLQKIKKSVFIFYWK